MSNYAPQPASIGSPPEKKSSTGLRMLVGCVGIAILGIIIVIGGSLLIRNKAQQAGYSPSATRKNHTASVVGKIKTIRVSDRTLRNDLPVFMTKDALIRYLLAFNKADVEALLLILRETFPVKDYTPVLIVDYDPIGKGLYEVQILEGPNKGRSGWVMDMDLRNP
jgi:hypothetical protein